jgi:predicted transcriptional regulator
VHPTSLLLLINHSHCHQYKYLNAEFGSIFKQKRSNMIDPSLEGDPANGAGCSISDVNGISDEIKKCNEEAERLQNKFELHAKSMQEIHKKIVSNQSASKALNNLAKNTTKNKKAKDQSSTQRRPHQPISGEVKKLIENEIFENNKKQVVWRIRPTSPTHH